MVTKKTDNPKTAGDDLFHPSDTRRSLPIALLRAREAMMSHFRPMLQKHGVTDQQWRVIRVLAETEEMEVSEVAGQAFILGPSLSRILPSLEARELIQKRRDPDDGRRYWLAITTKGRRLIGEVMPDSRQIYNDFQQRLGKKRIDDLLNLLNDVESLLKR